MVTGAERRRKSTIKNRVSSIPFLQAVRGTCDNARLYSAAAVHFVQ